MPSAAAARSTSAHRAPVSPFGIPKTLQRTKSKTLPLNFRVTKVRRFFLLIQLWAARDRVYTGRISSSDPVRELKQRWRRPAREVV